MPSQIALSLGQIDLLLLVAALVAIVTQRLSLPYSVGLVAAGIACALLPVRLGFELSKDLVYQVFLPPLVFEAALQLQWPALRRNLLLAVGLAAGGVLATALVVAYGMHWLVGWPLGTAWVFGTLIAATDPVAVVSVFKETGVGGRLRLLVESESLMNDGVAAVAFGIAVTAATAGTHDAVGVGMALTEVVRSVAGGLGCGVAVAFAMLWTAGRTRHDLVEITLTVVAAYGAFLLAERFEASGVLAVLAAGLVVGNRGKNRGALAPQGHAAVDSFWAFGAFAANSLVFLLIGLLEAELDLQVVVVQAGIAVLLIVTARAAFIYSLGALLARTRHAIEPRTRHILFWGGLRGALSLALALGLPADLPERGAVVLVSFSVVAFSIFAQGLTIKPLLRWLCSDLQEPPQQESEPRRAKRPQKQPGS